jgi:hypothetical protein
METAAEQSLFRAVQAMNLTGWVRMREYSRFLIM